MTVPATLLDALIWWSDAKNALEASSPVGNHLIHLAAGLALWAATVRLARRRRLTAAWAVTGLAALANEAADLAVERWPSLSAQLCESATDIGWTLAGPVLLTAVVVARRR